MPHEELTSAMITDHCSMPSGYRLGPVGARTGLSRALVTSEAEALVDRDGWRQLTITALARRLGVQGPSLYHHIGSLDALLADVQVTALAELSNRLQRAAMGKVGPECFHALAGMLCTYATDHPGLYELSQGKALDPARAIEAAEPARAALRAAIESFGISDPSMDLLFTCLAPLHGVLALSRSGAIESPKQRAAVYQRASNLVVMLLESEGKG
jgi:AcrR family transcriptional regulator